jgi:hypothetical protein
MERDPAALTAAGAKPDRRARRRVDALRRQALGDDEGRRAFEEHVENGAAAVF